MNNPLPEIKQLCDTNFGSFKPRIANAYNWRGIDHVFFKEPSNAVMILERDFERGAYTIDSYVPQSSLEPESAIEKITLACEGFFKVNTSVVADPRNFEGLEDIFPPRVVDPKTVDNYSGCPTNVILLLTRVEAGYSVCAYDRSSSPKKVSEKGKKK